VQILHAWPSTRAFSGGSVNRDFWALVKHFRSSREDRADAPRFADYVCGLALALLVLVAWFLVCAIGSGAPQ
jgi:hypothetical protein